MNPQQKQDAIVKVGEHARQTGFEFFHDRWREAWASVPVKQHVETWRVESREMRSWVERAFYEKCGCAPRGWVDLMLDDFRLRALYDGEQREVHVRTTEADGILYIDMADEQWRATQVTPTGWSVVKQPAVKFRRTLGSAPLPEPKTGGDLCDLFRYLNVRSENEILLLAWLSYSLRCGVPYPILAFSGVQGAGKSTASRMLRALVDPSFTELTAAPRSERDLIMAASNSRVLAFDNLSQISPDFSDALCRVATGGAHRERKYFTNDGSERLFVYQNPVIINGIENLPQRPDLLDRTILVHLEPITEQRRCDDSLLKRQFEEARPYLFGALLDTVVAELSNMSCVHLPTLPRMADFCRWGVAIEQHLGFVRGTFLEAYSKNRDEAVCTAIEASPVARLLHEYARKGQWPAPSLDKSIRFHGTALQLLRSLLHYADEHGSWTNELVIKNPKFPKAANQLSAEIARIEPNLAKMGISVKRSRTNTTRYITLQVNDDSDSNEANTVTFQVHEPKGVHEGVTM